MVFLAHFASVAGAVIATMACYQPTPNPSWGTALILGGILFFAGSAHVLANSD